jgi:hypothetical protein
MNQLMNKLIDQAGFVRYSPEENANTPIDWSCNYDVELEKLISLVVRECNQAVLEVPCYYKDYRDQIEKAVIHDCARAVLEKFGVE